MSTMRDHVERYAAFRRRLGYKPTWWEQSLRAFAARAMARGERFTRNDTILGWANEAPSPASIYNRLSIVRLFAVWLHAEDERHEVPPRAVPDRTRPRRPPPRLMTREQIGRIMEAALSLGPAGSITPHTCHYMIGLMAVTGLRRSEALKLRLSDITPDGLIVRETKFRKSRLVPLHETTRDALDRYLTIRKRVGGSDDHLFVVSTGRSPCPGYLTRQFIELARRTGLRGRRGPRLHDLRHSFCVRSLEDAVATDRDSVNRHMLALTTYVGHTRVSSTYWYLETTPALLRQVARTAENAHMERGSP